LLNWDSTKAANALARGGQSGQLSFFSDGDTMKVALAGGDPR
jgi:hypothetical protein